MGRGGPPNTTLESLESAQIKKIGCIANAALSNTRFVLRHESNPEWTFPVFGTLEATIPGGRSAVRMLLNHRGMSDLDCPLGGSAKGDASYKGKRHPERKQLLSLIVESIDFILVSPTKHNRDLICSCLTGRRHLHIDCRSPILIKTDEHPPFSLSSSPASSTSINYPHTLHRHRLEPHYCSHYLSSIT